jgi:hypothetical protein
LNKETPANGEAARLEHCLRCGSTGMKNNVYFCKGQSIRVYVQCASCGEFVARYTLRGYTSDTMYDSLLERLRYTRLNSGRRAMRIVEEFGSEVSDEYRHVLELIRTAEDERRIEEIIADDFQNETE